MPTFDFLHMPAWTCICLSALCGGWEGGGGGGGDDVHANATFVFCFLCSPCSGLVWCGTLVGKGGFTDDDACDVADAAIVFMTK